MKKYRLVVDGNYFLFRTLFGVPNKKGIELLKSDSDVGFFITKLAMDFSYQVKLFKPVINSIVWTIDSKSWRKDLYPETEYKANRKDDKNINWDNFRKATDIFSNILKENGVYISRVDGAEGDDLMYAWNTISLSKNKPVILLTGDGDLKQLINKNSHNDAHTIMYSPVQRVLYANEYFKNWLSSEIKSNNVFGLIDSDSLSESYNKKHLNELINTKVSLKEIDSVKFKFKKILCGDTSDNILPVYYKFTNNKRYGIGDKTADKIINSFIERWGEIDITYLLSDDVRTNLADIIHTTVKSKIMSVYEITNNIHTNFNLMILSQNTIPNDILDNMFKHIESQLDSDNELIIENLISHDSILKNSSELLSNSSIEYNFIKDDAVEDFSFIKK